MKPVNREAGDGGLTQRDPSPTAGGGGVDERSDEQLLGAFASGEDGALGELARRHEAGMLGVAKGLLGSEALACEAVQEAWVRVIRGAKGYRGRAAVRTWLYRIVLSRCSDVRAREARARRRRDPTGPVEVKDMDLARLARAVDGLPREHRETLVLCYGRGMSQSEAAGVLRVPLGTVKSRMHAAMGRLREALSDEAGGVA